MTKGASVPDQATHASHGATISVESSPSGECPSRKKQARHYARYIRRMCGTSSKKPGVSLGRATMLDLADFLESIAE